MSNSSTALQWSGDLKLGSAASTGGGTASSFPLLIITAAGDPLKSLSLSSILTENLRVSLSTISEYMLAVKKIRLKTLTLLSVRLRNEVFRPDYKRFVQY